MSVLLWIVLASLLGGAISVCAAALVGYAASPRSIPLLISYSVGALLGAAIGTLVMPGVGTGAGASFGDAIGDKLKGLFGK